MVTLLNPILQTHYHKELISIEVKVSTNFDLEEDFTNIPLLLMFTLN